MSRLAMQEPIEAGKVYPLSQFMKLTGLGRHAMRTARHEGLKVLRCGGKSFVKADDWFEHLDRVNGFDHTTTATMAEPLSIRG